MKEKEAILVIDSSERNSDLLYASKFWAPDPFGFIKTYGKKILVISSLEAERAKKQAAVDKIIDYDAYQEKKGLKVPSLTESITLILEDLRITTVVVPVSFSYKTGKFLETKGFSVKVKEEPFFAERAIKSPEEIEYITEVQRAVEEVLEKTLEIIRKSEIQGDFLHYQNKRQVLTSEQIRRFITIELLKRDCVCEMDSIVSSGEQTSVPHNLGAGPLKANVPIIIDIFPRSKKTRYWADITRTVVKGEANLDIKELYQVVLNAQKKAISMVKPDINGFEIDKTVRDFFESQGYKTGEINNEMQGFIHSTGHGVGLDIHEYPPITKRGGYPLNPGNVFTIEPGLYYHDLGGVRIEDLVVVTNDGCKNLTHFPKRLMEL